MERKPLKIGEPFESNTEYYAEKSRYDVYLKDTTFVQSAVYTACCDNHDDKDMQIALYIKDKENITIDFGGTTLYLHGEMQPILLENCKNVTIKNCVIEFDRSFVSEAEVIESTPNYLKVKMGKNFPYRIDDGNLIMTSEMWENNDLDKAPMFFQYFHKETHQGAGLSLAIVGKNAYIDENLPWASSTLRYVAMEDGENIILAGKNLPIIEAGLVLAIGHSSRKYSGIMLVDCENIFLTNDRILNGPGMGLLPIYTKNLYLDGFKLCYDEKSPGIISNEADGIHAVACSGDFVLKNCILEGMIDDALNVHGNFYQLESYESTKIVASSAGEHTEDFKLFGVGDKIAVYKGATLIKTGEYTIQAIEQKQDKTFEMVLDKAVLNHQKGDTIENLSRQAKITISNCRFGKANTHLRFQSRGEILIEDSETELPIWLTGDMSYWFESSPVENMTIKDTKFVTPQAIVFCNPEFMPSEEEPYYHGHLTIKNCEFDSSKPVIANYTKHITFIENKAMGEAELYLELNNCGDAEIDNNHKIIRKTEKKESLNLN